MRDNPANAVTTKFVKTVTNKMYCPVSTLAWTPEGRRLITGASSGDFTLWNGLTFRFETIFQVNLFPLMLALLLLCFRLMTVLPASWCGLTMTNGW